MRSRSLVTLDNMADIKCKTCGAEVTVTKAVAARILQEGRKMPTTEERRAWGTKGSSKRWAKHIKNDA